MTAQTALELTMKLTVSSVLPTSTKRAWGLLRRSDTLVFIAHGMVTYRAARNLPEYWQTGYSIDLQPRLFGGKPGHHIICFKRIDDAERCIETIEHGGNITQWDHTMQLTELTESQCRYTDTIIIDAGRSTLLVYLFAFFFYRHRHRRWRRLLKISVPKKD